MTTLHHIWDYHYHCDFASGVQLLKEHNPGAVTRNIMARLSLLAATGEKPTAYELGKLTEAIAKTPAEELTDLESELAKQIKPGTQDVIRETVKAKTTTDRAKQLHKEHAHAHTQMVLADTDESRAKHAAEIMENIIPSLDAEYDNGVIGDTTTPFQKQKTELTGSQLRELQSLRSRISRLQKTLIPGTNDKAKKANLEKELADKINRKTAIENIIA